MSEWLVLGLVALILIGFIAAYARRRAREEIVIHAAPDHLWSILTDHRRFPEWQPEIEQVTPEAGEGSGGGVGWIETHKDGLRYRYDVQRAEPPRRITWRYEALGPADESSGGESRAKEPVHPAAGQGRGAGGIWTLTLEPRRSDASAGAGLCRVRSRVIDRRSGSLWSRMINALRGPRSHQALYLDCLKARAEGEPRGASLAPTGA